jgi:hypothetical protein
MASKPEKQRSESKWQQQSFQFWSFRVARAIASQEQLESSDQRRKESQC